LAASLVLPDMSDCDAIEKLRAEMNALPDWYHRIDLGHGLVTPGRDYEPIWSLCRAAMDQVDFRGKRVLDVGACDGQWSFEAERRGAAAVVAVDLFDYALERFLFCKRVLRSRVTPLYNVSVYRLADSLGRQLSPTAPPLEPYANKFDIVLFFGVLYHLRDPLRALAQVRSVVKNEGVVLLETAYAHAEDRSVMLFHGGARKRFYNDPTTWWIPSESALIEMGETSLLRARVVSRLTQDHQAGRISAVCAPTTFADLDPEMAYEIANHYPTPGPSC
jgi:tRNA (mo5U34)-methyltransferase